MKWSATKGQAVNALGFTATMICWFTVGLSIPPTVASVIAGQPELLALGRQALVVGFPIVGVLFAVAFVVDRR